MKRSAAVLGVAATVAAVGACAPYRALTRADLVVEPQPCVQTQFPIYFQEGSARLTPPARALIGVTAAGLRDCDVRQVRVLGLADASGAPGWNQKLSEARARTVAQAFARSGWPEPAFEVAAAGDAGAVTAEGRMEPMRRRTEVIVDAAPR